ncbi:serine hydroxymethyltransferase [Pantoea ananatis]|jgi:glycine hydroxymethyltransferase|uniref:serine hydroxymethyltransferase n=2 Tax=Pantoea ananas TaxID=553 RepID=UPI00137616ED|nr:hypothetical protein [Pantoea ananatis]NCU09153.1 hypothetical protein [Pantoea ananatis]
MSKKNLDDYIDNLLVQEKIRQDNNITFIASEWAMMAPVRKALSSIFAEKYFEGTPVDRSYNILREKGLIDRELIALKKPGWFSPGCNIYDDLSWLCQSTLLDLFDPEKLSNYYVDNRVLSGSQANQAVFLSIMKKKRKKELKILSLDLIHGGHLSHGIKNSLIGILHEIIPYHVNETTETVDYQELEIIALNHNPDLIIYGGSSCPRDWDHNKMMSIVSKLPESNLLFDGSHPAGLIAAGLNNNPFHAGVHFITMTTNKTLCGARGAFVACLPQWAEVLSKAVFPGLTAGPHGHEMYAKLIGYRCAKKNNFIELMKTVKNNASLMARELSEKYGLRIVTGGTDTHMVLVDIRSENNKCVSGLDVEILAEECGIYMNRNTIPFDPQPDQNKTSGVRIGLGSVSQRGMGSEHIKELSMLISLIIRDGNNLDTKKFIKKRVLELTSSFPIMPFYR